MLSADIDQEHMARLSTRFQHRHNLHVRRCDLSNTADFSDFQASMDTVVCLNVLEHVEDDIGALNNIFSALSKGGTGHRTGAARARDLWNVGCRAGSPPPLLASRTAGEDGTRWFQRRKNPEFQSYFAPGWYVSGRILKRTTLGATQMALFDQARLVWRRIDQRLPWPPTSIIAIAASLSG